MGPRALNEMSDNEVIEYAQEVYDKFRIVERDTAENDDLLRRWGAVCTEMYFRGITDGVTEGGGGDVIDLMTGKKDPSQ